MWSRSPPEPIPVETGMESLPSTRPRVDRPSRLLPVTQCLAEGGLLAVIAAAIQAVFGEIPILGPIEFAVLAGFGMAWARRKRWRGPAGEAFGLPIIAVAGGTLAWLVAADVRLALVQGDLQAAITAHPGGWVGALAVLRGHAHLSRSVDEEVQDSLMRWGLPILAGAWFIGGLAATRAGADVSDAFTAVAYVGSLVFVSAGVLALGLARLATVRGGDGPGGGSWFGFVLVVALGMTAIGILAALLLGVPLEALVVALVAPIRLLGALLLLLFSPVVILAALIIDLAQGVLPEGFAQGQIRLPSIEFGTGQPTSPLPGVLFYVIVGAIIAIELVIVALYLWWRWRDRREMASLLSEVAEERTFVFDRPPRTQRPPRREPEPAIDAGDPAGAYVLALAALDADGRWSRREAETPRHHVARVADELPAGDALARLAAAYQLARYGGRALTARERGRSAVRLARVRESLRG